MIRREDLQMRPWFEGAYPFASRFMQVDGERLHYLDEGTGPAVVFVHGTPSWSYEFRRAIVALRPHHRCLALDHLGFGLSARPGGADYTLRAHTRRLERWLEALEVGPMSLVMHDFGGPIALPIVLDGPRRVTRLVLANSWAWPFERTDPPFARRRAMLDSFVVRWLYRHANLSARVLVKKAWGSHRPLTPTQHAAYLQMFPDPASRVGTCAFAAALARGEGIDLTEAQAHSLASLPTLILWGEEDLALKPAFLARWRQLLPHAQTYLCPRAGHFLFEEAADAVGPVLADFLAASTS